MTYTIAFSAAALYLLWLGYVLTMHVLNRWPYLPWAARIAGALPALCAYLFDIALNLTLCTVLFWDWPREATITQRLHRYQREAPSSKRAAVARWVCRNLLNPFDPEHC
jgi:hypothetical protein